MNFKTTNFQIKIDEGKKFSPAGGALLISAFFDKFGLRKIIDENIGASPANCRVKYTDSSYIESLVIMQALGGETVDDLKFFTEDGIFNRVVGGIPGHTSTHNYIANFNDMDEEGKRGKGRSFVPEPNEHLKGFRNVTKHLLSNAPHIKDIASVTLDQDATFIPTNVQGSLFNYKSERSFEAFNTYCPEYDMVIASEFRDGNVKPGYRQLENLRESLELLPETVSHVRLRSDTAGYQTELLKFCAEGKNERFGVIEFAIGSPVTKDLKEAVKVTRENEWRKIPDTDQECAEIVFVPNSLGNKKTGSEYRFIVTREELADAPVELRQKLLFDDDGADNLPISDVHPTSMNGGLYKIFAIVTNLPWTPKEIVLWYRGRCGKSEELHRILKDELAGGHVVTSALGANAAWWQINILTFNILAMIKSICLGEEHMRSRPKKLRYCLFLLVVRLGRHARKKVLTVYRSAQATLFHSAWNKLERVMLRTE
jgi:hypothetical protein